MSRPAFSWNECPDVDCCELVLSFLKLVDSMVKDMQHLQAETIRARYELSLVLDPSHEWITALDILSGVYAPPYDNLAYQQFVDIYYDGGDPFEFKEFTDAMERIATGQDDQKY